MLSESAKLALERTDLYDSTALHPGGLEHAGTILRSTHPDLVVSKQKLRRAEVIEHLGYLGHEDVDPRELNSLPDHRFPGLNQLDETTWLQTY